MRDRLSWMRRGPAGSRGPGARRQHGSWDFREALIRAGALDELFAEPDRAIAAAASPIASPDERDPYGALVTIA